MLYVAVHGGAGVYRDPDRLKSGMQRALKAALEARNALDAVEEAVKVLEDDPNFNAGTGSILNIRGEVEMDAMIAHAGGVGGVAAIRNVRNPISVARKVMEESKHVLLVGEGALHFARRMGFGEHDPVTEERRERWRELIAARKEEGALETVGAVAYDGSDFAAATSTGGRWLKLPGRVGDTPIFGAGTYASERGAASATGHGEEIIKKLVAYHAVEGGEDPMKSARLAIGNIRAGVIVVNARGVGYAYNTEMMPLAVYDGERRRFVL